MSLGDWMVVIGWLPLTAMLGLGVLRLLRTPATDLMRDWATCFVAGQLVWLVLVLLTAFTPATMLHLMPFAVGLGLLNVVRAVCHAGVGASVRIVVVSIMSILVAALLFPNLAVLAFSTPALEIDARTIWLFHGKALFFGGGIDPKFFAEPLHYWSSPDYPLLLPAQAAWISMLLGRWDEIGSRTFLWFHFAAWCRLLYLVLVRRGVPSWLSIPLVFGFCCFGVSVHTPGFSFVSGQADYHCSLPMLLAMLVLGTPRSTVPIVDVEGHAPFVALMLAAAAATKNEGTIYAILFTLMLCLWFGLSALRCEGWRGAVGSVSRLRVTWLLAATLAVLPWWGWAHFKATHGIGSNLHIFDRATAPGLLNELLASRLPTVLETMWDDPQLQLTQWVIVALLALVVISLGLRAGGVCGIGMRTCEPLQAGACVLVLSLIALTYVLTPHDFVYHMATSLTRLMFFPMQMVFVLVIFRFDAIRQGLLSAASKSSASDMSGS